MDEDFAKWVAQWAAAEQEIAHERQEQQPEPEPEPPLRTSFFNNSPAEFDYEDEEAPGDWHSLYARSMQVDYSKDDSLITDSLNIAYMGSEGYGKHLETGKSATGGKKVYTNNPIHFASVGNDQEDDEGRTRVTNNWSDGKELQELADIKRKVEEMERKCHEADVLKKKGNIASQLESLRKRVKQLSEKLTSTPQEDLT